MKETLAQELDFINEGENSERCQKDLKHLLCSVYTCVWFIHVKLTKISSTETFLRVWFIQVKLTKISSTETFLRAWFIHSHSWVFNNEHNSYPKTSVK
jgi:hypothetical protein